jgi:hypothetical protein
MKRSAALALLLAAGCTGSVAGGGGSSAPPPGNTGMGAPMGGGNPMANPGGPAGPTPGPGSTCDTASLPRARTWRLTGAQFRNTALAVFGFAGPTAADLPADGQPDGFSNQADRLSVSPLLASKYLQAADEIAASVVARNAEFIRCPVTSLGTGDCLRDFLTTVGARAWRRPLTAVEVGKYTSLFGTIARANTPEVAFKGVVQALVLSPNFLFRTELGDGAGTSTIALTDHELAAALSYMLVDAPPDATLAGLAAAGKLRDPATLAGEARRLLSSTPAAARIAGAFFRQWLQFDSLPDLSKDAALFPAYTPEVVADLLAEGQALVDAVLFAGGEGNMKALLTATDGYVNARTAPLYGVQASGTALVKTALPADQRRGLLTGAAFIAAASDADDTNLPARGRIFREQVLCATVAPPPGNFVFEDPKITPDMTNREKLITHTSNPACASCHALFDGIGYAMEQYDAIGRYRTTDKKKTIDATGSLPLPGGTLQFTSYVDLIDQVSRLPETYQCLAFQYDAYATGRASADIPQCERDLVARAFADGGFRLDALVSAIVTSPTFTFRRN